MKISSDGVIQPNVAAQAQKAARLADAAQQFEASMLQELLKPLQDNKAGWGGDDAGDDQPLDTLRGFGTESVAKAIAKGGGFGIARHIIEQVTQENWHNSVKSKFGN